MKYAELLYFKTFGKELPLRDYRKQDIEYIIQQLEMNPEEGVFNSFIIH